MITNVSSCKVLKLNVNWTTDQMAEDKFEGVWTDYYRGADKFLARPGRKQATATKL